MEAKTIERKYQLIKIQAGDWLLPDNNGQTLWRLRQYEDGPSHGWTDMERDELFWGVWEWKGPDPTKGGLNIENLDDWDLWAMWDGNMETRSEAIEVALTNKT